MNRRISSPALLFPQESTKNCAPTSPPPAGTTAVAEANPHHQLIYVFSTTHCPALLPPSLYATAVKPKLDPQDANLRGGFLLKLSTASASSSDAVKLSLVLLQAELLGFTAVHTPAHADLAAGWCCSLVNTALSLDSDASWESASRAIGGVAIFLLSEFRGDSHVLSISVESVFFVSPCGKRFQSSFARQTAI